MWSSVIITSLLIDNSQTSVVFFDNLGAYTPAGLSHECFSDQLAKASGPNTGELGGFMSGFETSTRDGTRYIYGIEKAFELLLPFAQENSNSERPVVQFLFFATYVYG